MQLLFFFKQKTAYEMRIIDWSSDVCSSDLPMKRSTAEILREYGPLPGADQVHGVTFDGRHVWFASGDRLNALDPASGQTLRAIDVAAHAGTAFDGRTIARAS